jgi:hypothetical protein
MSYILKKVLADSQDNVFKRVQELKDQIDSERNSKKDLEAQHKIKLAEKDTIISHLKNQVQNNILICFFF